MKMFKKNNQEHIDAQSSSTGNQELPKEMVNHPSHYNQYPVEVIDMMIRIFGKEATKIWCIMTAFKYRMRAGHKDNVEQDLAKEQWYLNKAKELEEKI